MLTILVLLLVYMLVRNISLLCIRDHSHHPFIIPYLQLVALELKSHVRLLLELLAHTDIVAYS